MSACRVAYVKKKMRLDRAIVESGLLKSRTLAKQYVESGKVSVNGVIMKKPSVDVGADCEIALESEPPKFVSRGGEKLEEALMFFGLDVSGAVCCDIGASTGGFTDCLLKHGASRVIAVDSGTAQLDPSLLTDPRVVSVENFNARDLTVEVTGCLCDAVTVDVSFISQTYIMPNAVSVLKTGGIYVGLIKPQFECGRERLGKRGIVKDEDVRYDSIQRVTRCAEECGLTVKGVIPSPIKGGDGNVEYLAYCIKNNNRI